MMAEDCSWPKRTRPLRHLTEDQYAAWERDGYLMLPGIVPLDLCANAAAAVRRFIGADDSRPETWYTNIHDIYDATLSPRPAHGPCGMVQLYHTRRCGRCGSIQLFMRASRMCTAPNVCT